MIFVSLSFVFGSLIGFLSYHYEKLIVAIYMSFFPMLLFAVVHTFVPLLYMYKDVPSKLPGHEPGEHTVLTALLTVPDEFQLALILLPVFIITARLLTWFFTIGLTPETRRETRQELKQRVRGSYDLE